MKHYERIVTICQPCAVRGTFRHADYDGACREHYDLRLSNRRHVTVPIVEIPTADVLAERAREGSS